MEDLTVDTFFGKLTQSPVTNGHYNNYDNDPSVSSYYYIQYLERKVTILEDIVNTSNLIAEINQTMLSNHDQTVHVKLSDVGVQADLEPVGHSPVESVSSQTDIQICPRLCYEPDSPQTQVEYDGICDAPQSFMVIDGEGRIEASESILALDEKGQDSEAGSVNPWCGNYYQTLAVSNISSVALSDHESISDNSETNCNRPVPVELINDSPFAKFSIDILLSELDFTHNFQNRKTLYYGQFPYHYSGGNHAARDIPRGSYLASICSYLDVLFPDYEYNSALINFYETGHDFMPSHSDTEECIEDDSHIVTVSIGATRTLLFKDMITGQNTATLELQHGDVCIMSKESQGHYKHEILPNSSCSNSRISITFRLIKPQVPPRHNSTPKRMDIPTTNPFDTDAHECGYVPYSEHTDQTVTDSKEIVHDRYTWENPPAAPPSRQNYAPNTPSTQHPKYSEQDVDTLYISSSMFRGLDESKLSSKKQKAKLFFFPGANSQQMINRLLQDQEFQSINKNSVKNVFLLTGTNYVDSISSGSLSMGVAIKGINDICFKLWDMCVNAKLNIINILPRVDKHKNNTVNKLNDAIINICRKHGLTFIDTEHKTKLFSSNGFRKSFYFRIGYDDVHLNRAGISRLGKHLKYLAHNI